MTQEAKQIKCQKQNLRRYPKSQKQDNARVTPLKLDGNLFTDAAGKADVLSKQFPSVFAKERIDLMPNKGPSSYQDLPYPLHGME